MQYMAQARHNSVIISISLLKPNKNKTELKQHCTTLIALSTTKALRLRIEFVIQLRVISWCWKQIIYILNTMFAKYWVRWFCFNFPAIYANIIYMYQSEMFPHIFQSNFSYKSICWTFLKGLHTTYVEQFIFTYAVLTIKKW